MTTPQPGLASEDRIEITALVDRWLELLAAVPFVQARPYRQWILDRALRQGNAESARVFVNDAMWALRLGDPLEAAPPTPSAAPASPGLDDADRDVLARELDERLHWLVTQGAPPSDTERRTLVDEAAGEPTLEAARLLIETRVAEMEEHQVSELWDLADHWVAELAAVNFNIPPDAKAALVRRFLSLYDLREARARLSDVFERLHERATTPVPIFSIEVEMHLRRGLAARRAATYGATDEEIDEEKAQAELRQAISRSRYRAHGATDQDEKRHQDEQLQPLRAQLEDLLTAYEAEVTRTLEWMKDLLNSSDEAERQRAQSVVPNLRHTLEGRWQWLRQGLADPDLSRRDLQIRIRHVEDLENLIQNFTLSLPYLTGQTDLEALARRLTVFQPAFADRYKSMPGEHQVTGKKLIDEAKTLLDGNPGITATLDLINRIAAFGAAAFADAKPAAAARAVLPDGYFDSGSTQLPADLAAWVAAKAHSKNSAVSKTNIGQVVTDVVAGRGKDSGTLPGGAQVLHASAGKQGTSECCTVFFARLDGGLIRIVGVGQHHDSGGYAMLWSDPDFTTKKIWW